MKKVAAIIALVLSGLGIYTGTAQASVNYDRATCSAFNHWVGHRTPGNLRRMVLDSNRADTYLRVDVGNLYEAVRHGARTSADIRYVRLDCTIGADE